MARVDPRAVEKLFVKTRRYGIQAVVDIIEVVGGVLASQRVLEGFRYKRIGVEAAQALHGKGTLQLMLMRGLELVLLQEPSGQIHIEIPFDGGRRIFFKDSVFDVHEFRL
ncbi:hypothetical protein D3C77_633140 [compost metagenome]